MQTLGQDYELLVASHRHVSVDSMSGSLKESEPTSPVSPSSPDPWTPSPAARDPRHTSPATLVQALATSLQAEPPSWRRPFAHSLKNEVRFFDLSTSLPQRNPSVVPFVDPLAKCRGTVGNR